LKNSVISVATVMNTEFQVLAEIELVDQVGVVLGGHAEFAHRLAILDVMDRYVGLGRIDAWRSGRWRISGSSLVVPSGSLTR
jgi:hypothetical protein